MEKYSAILTIELTDGETPSANPLLGSLRSLSRAFPCEMVKVSQVDFGAYQDDKLWVEFDYKTLITLRIYSHKSLLNIHRMCSILENWTLLVGGRFSIETISGQSLD